MKTNRAKALSTTALIAVLCMQLFWMWNSFEMTVHQMGFETPWNLAPDVRAQALLAAFYESKFTVLTSLLTTVVIILSLIDQINYIDGLSYMSFRGLESLSASSSVMLSAPGPLGTCLATASVSA